MWTRASAATVPVADRFEWFNELVASALIPTAIKSEESADFRAEAAMLDLGVTQVSTFAHSPLSSRRTPALIRRGDPEQYQLALITGGRWWMSHSGGDEEFGVGDMILWDTSRPQETVAHPGDGPSRSVILHLPKDVLPLRSGRVDRLLGRRIASDSGMAAVLAGFIASLREHGSACEPQELRRLGSVAVDLAAACLAHRLDAYGELPAEARARALRERIDAFIEHNLGDPALTPGLIAAAHGISVRSLHMLFGEEGRASRPPSGAVAWSAPAPIWPARSWPAGPSTTSRPAGASPAPRPSAAPSARPTGSVPPSSAARPRSRPEHRAETCAPGGADPRPTPPERAQRGRD